MCGTCGCGEDDGPRYTHLTEHAHHHEHPRTVVLEQRVLGRNDDLAAQNRRELAARGIVAINLMSSPGSGKTTLLERTIADLAPQWPIGVLEGDQETLLDATRIRAAGAPVVQINTGAGCHLDAEMLRGGLAALEPAPGSLLFIENVGNLVCPALFDLGETGRVVVMSVTEGDDKPIKYPHMFASADLVVLNKSDLLPYLNVDLARTVAAVGRVNPHSDILTLAATGTEPLSGWYEWLRNHRAAASRPRT